MPLRVCVLGSSSSGNCTYVATEKTAILIDAGLSGRQIASRLEQIGVTLEQINAVCLSHEHNDHTAALSLLQRRWYLPLYANRGTVEALSEGKRFRGLKWNIFTTGSSFRVGDMVIHPFAVPHDAYEPVGFRATGPDGTSATIVTDVGIATGLLRDQIRHSNLLVIESNHDEHLLKNSSRPPSLIQRILGRQGHLSNEAVGRLLAESAHPSLQWVLLAHLSEECNRPALAAEVVQRALELAGFGQVRVECCYPDRPSPLAIAAHPAAVAQS